MLCSFWVRDWILCEGGLVRDSSGFVLSNGGACNYCYYGND